jgi:hypothetical protein
MPELQVPADWYDLSMVSNRLRQTYVNGFLDVSNIFTARRDANIVGTIRQSEEGMYDAPSYVGTNVDSLTVNENFTLDPDCVFTFNSNDISNTGVFNNDGSFNNTGDISNVGVFNNDGSFNNTGDFINNGRLIINEGVLYTDVSFTGTSDISVNSLNASNINVNAINASGGNVGIGTTNPATEIHIHNQNSSISKLLVTNTGSSGTNDGNGFGVGTSGGVAFLNNYENNNLVLATNNVTRMTITSNGNVGIGTDNPQERLHLSNRMRIDGGANSPGIWFYGNGVAGDNNQVFFGRGSGSFSGIGFYFSSWKHGFADNGNVGFGTISPAVGLHLNQGARPGENSNAYGMRFSNTNNSNYWGLFISNNDHFRFVYNTSAKGYVDQNDGNAQMNFTGQHRTFVKHVSVNKVDSYTGLIVSSDQNKYIKMSGGIEKGNKAITINEALPIVSISKTEKDKKCFGVISNAEDEESRISATGRFVSNYDKELGDTRIYINSVGEGAIWVSNKNGSLESGDYITTSSVPGYGQKQDDDLLHNYSVAKITMNCDFQPQLIYKEQIKREFVNITTDPGNSPHDISGNYFVENTHELLYGKIRTIDPSGNVVDEMVSDYQNTHYILDIDASNNLISAQKNVLDANGEIQWEDTEEQERAYDIRHLDASANIITEDEYNTKIAASEEAYIAAFVGCTYHCG